MRRARSLVPALAMAISLAGRAMAQDADGAAGALVVECRIGEVASTVLEAHVQGGTLLVPLRPVLALAGLDSTTAIGERPISDLAALLRADVTFDSATLVVQVADSGTLPVSRRAERSRARERLAQEAALRVAEPTPLARSFILPSSVSVGYAAQGDGSASLTASMRALDGVAELGVRRVASGGWRPGMSWTSVPWARLGGARLRAGTIDDLAGASGVMLTNAPVEWSDTLGSAAITAGGAERELYEDGVLVGADSIAGRARPELRLVERRGVHTVGLVTYDSSGRARVRRWTEYVPDALLPRGALRYAVAMRACGSVACARPLLRVAYAPLDRITVGARLARFDPSRPDGTSVMTMLDARLGASSALSVDASPRGDASAELRVERGRGESLVVRGGRGGVVQPIQIAPLAIGVPRRSVSAEGAWRLGAGGAANVVVGRMDSSAVVGASGSVTTRFGLARESVALIRGALRCAGVGSGVLLWGSWLPGVLAVARSAALSVRVERRTRGCGDASSGALGLLLPTMRWSALEVSATWQRAAPGPVHLALSVALRRRLGAAGEAHAELVGGAAAPIVRSGVSGAFVVDALRRSVSIATDATGVASGVHGVVFADANANGRRDVGERAIAGALVRVGEASAVSDGRGVYRVSGLVTDRVVRVTVDSVSVDAEGVVPGRPIAVLLVSRAIVRVDVPLRRVDARGDT